jgi:hypothetical protein
MLRTRLSLTRLEERETPSDLAPPVGPDGAPINPTPTTPAQTTPPSGGTTNPQDPHG